MEAPEKEDVYYRLEDYRESTSYLDVCGEYVITGSRVRVRVREYPVLKRTPAGAWIRHYDDFGNDRRFVKTGTRKCFAHPTMEEALVSFEARKKRQYSIYMARAKDAQEAITVANWEFRKWRSSSSSEAVMPG